MDYKSYAIELIDLYGYWALFVTMFLDTLGIPMPSKTMLTLSGYFLNLGIFNLAHIYLIAMVGTLGGFASGYIIGNRLGKPFLNKHGRYILITPEKLGKVEKFFKRYGTYAIFIAYFLPVARSIVPYLSGISKMPFMQAILMAAIGAICWITFLISFGFIVGQAWSKIEIFVMEYYFYLLAGFVIFTIAILRILKKNKNKIKQVE